MGARPGGRRQKTHANAARCGGAAPGWGGDNLAMTSNLPSHPAPLRLLALDTSTDRMSVAVGDGVPGGVAFFHEGPGAAQSSANLLPAVGALLAQAHWALGDLDALVLTRGPGSFTGVRTACAAAQGLAYGAQAQGRSGGVPVLPVDSLLALAEEARAARVAAGERVPPLIVALLDARMGEMYAAVYACVDGALVVEAVVAPSLCAPADLASWLPIGHGEADVLLAGNVFDTYAEALSALPGLRQEAWPTASALLRLAPGLLAAGKAVEAQHVMPLYVRDKVAQTTDERERLRLAALARPAPEAP